MIEIKKEIKKKVNKMKIIKMIMFVVSISLFTYTNAEARDCSNPKGFHEKLMCKLSGVGNADEKKSKTEETSKVTTEKKSAFKKIKNVLKQKTLKDAVAASKE